MVGIDLGRNQDFCFGCAKFEAPIRSPMGGVRWAVDNGSGLQESGLGWGHGAGKEAPYIVI